MNTRPAKSCLLPLPMKPRTGSFSIACFGWREGRNNPRFAFLPHRIVAICQCRTPLPTSDRPRPPTTSDRVDPERLIRLRSRALLDQNPRRGKSATISKHLLKLSYNVGNIRPGSLEVIFERCNQLDIVLEPARSGFAVIGVLQVTQQTEFLRH